MRQYSGRARVFMLWASISLAAIAAVIYNQAHMVLAYFPTPDAEPLILDNIKPAILPASQRGDLLPVYSFNGSSLWLAKEQSGRAQQVGGSDRIGQWRDLQARMRAAM